MIVDLLNMHPASGETNGAKTTNGGASRETTTAAAGEDITDARKIQGGEGRKNAIYRKTKTGLGN